jgi:hypothetical protein
MRLGFEPASDAELVIQLVSMIAAPLQEHRLIDDI